ncbi:hypothetical protein MRY82_10685 [bacterium]|nr:hypothetical protein [bacterium]
MSEIENHQNNYQSKSGPLNYDASYVYTVEVPETEHQQAMAVDLSLNCQWKVTQSNACTFEDMQIKKIITGHTRYCPQHIEFYHSDYGEFTAPVQLSRTQQGLECLIPLHVSRGSLANYNLSEFGARARCTLELLSNSDVARLWFYRVQPKELQGSNQSRLKF